MQNHGSLNAKHWENCEINVTAAASAHVCLIKTSSFGLTNNRSVLFLPPADFPPLWPQSPPRWSSSESPESIGGLLVFMVRVAIKILFAGSGFSRGKHRWHLESASLRLTSASQRAHNDNDQMLAFGKFWCLKHVFMQADNCCVLGRLKLMTTLTNFDLVMMFKRLTDHQTETRGERKTCAICLTFAETLNWKPQIPNTEQHSVESQRHTMYQLIH